MILNYDTIINRITVETSFTKQEIENKISQKLKDFQDLISKEGAAHMVANELNIGNKAQIQLNPPNETVGEIKINATSKRKDIADLKENEFAEVLGYIVQAFEPKFYNACPVCNKKLLPQDDKFTCIEHNLVDPKKVLIFNAFVDDGSSNIRVVFFRDVAEKLIGKEPSTFEDIKKNILGKQFLIKGKVNKNEMFSRIELMANSVE